MDAALIDALPRTDLGFAGLFLACALIGAGIGVAVAPVTRSLRRVTYIFSMACLYAFLIVTQAGWALLPMAQDGGWATGLIALLLALVGVYGAFLWRLSAARGHHIDGRPGWGWLVFVPVANLYLSFAPGRDAARGWRGGDVLLLIAAVAIAFAAEMFAAAI
ncbi:hypothetical protein [Jannaschia sp. 2305UL9-9]|uniref:hypothetical protein n=1 Tax=Jannaschia sp. 2305UL9-9 TaxID=3121638 RepID=UPI003528271B